MARGWERPASGQLEWRCAIGEADGRAHSPPDMVAAARQLSGAERAMWESAERGVRHYPDFVALILHLSSLAAPAPRPYHSRIAKVLLHDTAARFGGQVFVMRNQDMVLLARAGLADACHAAGESENLLVHRPEVLAGTLATLFSADVPSNVQLTSLLRLSGDLATLQAYLTGCAKMQPLAPQTAQPCGPVLSLAALQSTLNHAPLAELLVMRTGMRLRPDRHISLAERLVPAFRCVELSFSALKLGDVVAQAINDPFLLRHLAGDMDSRLIALLSNDVAKGGGLTRLAVRCGVPVHVKLGLSAVMSPEFDRLARGGANVGLRFGVAVSLMQVSADLDRLEEARRVLATLGGELVITELQPRQMQFAVPAALRPNLVKLSWSASLASEDTMLWADHGAGFDPARTVLQGVDTQRALAWGQACGFMLFEGAFLDQIQAAHRMSACRHAAECTLGQCCSRARSAGACGRAGCHDPALLDGDRAAATGMGMAA